MLTIALQTQSKASAAAAIASHLGAQVVVVPLVGPKASGQLLACTPTALTLHGLPPYLLSGLQCVRVKGRGDWQRGGKGTRQVARTAKCNVRLHEAEKRYLASAAAKCNLSLTAFLLQASLQAASAVLSAPLPAP